MVVRFARDLRTLYRSRYLDTCPVSKFNERKDHYFCMKVLITGSSGHLGEALVRTSEKLGYDVAGLDLAQSTFTSRHGSITNRELVRQSMEGVKTIFHTATLHKPHAVTHNYQQFIDTNISGTMILLEEAVRAKVETFIFTSTTSVFGNALVPPPGSPAAWITEDVRPAPKNIYGVTKEAAENLCRVVHKRHGLAVIVLRTSRFFPEEDDDRNKREVFEDSNLKANEYLFRRVDLQDVVQAHLDAAGRASSIGFGTYLISATTPFLPADMTGLRKDAPGVVQRLFEDYEAEYSRRSWKMFPQIDRVYVNEKARQELGWKPVFDFRHVLDLLKAGEDPRSSLARIVGSKGYHDEIFAEGPYPV